MLVLSRKVGQRLVIGDNITVTVTRISGNRVTIGIEAPDDVRILRGELVVVVDDFKEDRLHLDNKTVANHVTLLITMLNAAVRRRWLREAPHITKPRIPLFSRDYRYLRTDDEIRRFLGAGRGRACLRAVLHCNLLGNARRRARRAAPRRCVLVTRPRDKHKELHINVAT